MSGPDAEFWKIVRANWTPAERWSLAVPFAIEKYRAALD